MLNAAAAIYVSGVVTTLEAAVDAARSALRERRGAERLAALQAATR
ncbi:MAG: hypothetical protein IPG05_08880 [Gemmatimonadetes bacterium]|nr:hypothetical protein [Gemmatimonadota bacterium]